MLKKKSILLIALVSALFVLQGCAFSEPPAHTNTSVSMKDNLYTVPEIGAYDCADTAVITGIDSVNKTITFYNYELRKSYTLEYDSLTRFADKYGTALTAGQLKEGTVTDVLFLKSKKQLVSLSEAAKAFTVTDVTGFSVDINSKVFTYKNDSYKITEGTVLLADDRKLSLQDLSPADNVTLTGFENEIYSITINKGHGYLVLRKSSHLVGGYLEIGNDYLEAISENMLVTLPAGDYPVVISKNGSSETRNISILSGKETILNVSDVKVGEPKVGKIYIEVTPESAKLYVDGEIVDHTRLLTFPVGLHRLSATAEGYESVTRYFNVGTETSSLEVELESTGKTEKKEEEESHTDGYFIFISSPSGVEVYFDGNYIGMSPLSIAKKAGNHTITLRKTGFETRNYNVLIENTAKDVYYAFDVLGAESSGTNGTSNGTSGNSENSGSATSSSSGKTSVDSVSGNP